VLMQRPGSTLGSTWPLRFIGPPSHACWSEDPPQQTTHIAELQTRHQPGSRRPNFAGSAAWWLFGPGAGD
jgi:hypothetical protein